MSYTKEQQRQYDSQPERMEKHRLREAARKLRPEVAAYRKAYEKEREPRLTKRLKREVILAYGGKCMCCGEREIEFLTIDHINGHGKEDRAQHGTGNQFYRHLRQEHPDHVQVLCFNCNWAKGHYGSCPHEREK